MKSFLQLPRRARVWMAVVWTTAIVLLLQALSQAGGWNVGDVYAWLALSGMAAVLDQFAVKVTHRSEEENYSVTDAMWVPVLIFAKPSVLTLAVATGIALGQVVRRWAWFKIVYNVSQFLISIFIAESIYAAFDLTVPPVTLTVWLAATAAMLVYFAVNELFIAFVISLVAKERLRTLLVLPNGLNALQAAGNLTVGLLAALVWSTGPVGIPLLLAPMVLVFLAYRGWLHVKREEEQARERERMRALYEAGRELSGPLDHGYDFKPFLTLIRKMLDASAVELVLIDGDVCLFNSEVGLALRFPQEHPPLPAERYVSTHPMSATFHAGIGDDGPRSGMLAVHRPTELSPAEGSLVEALASQIKVRGENERLLRETVDQKSHLADIIGNTSDGIFEVSGEQLIRSWNPAMERITGIPQARALGGPWADVIGADGTEQLSLEDPAPQDGRLRRADGNERWIRYTSSPVPGRNGEPTVYVVVARDVTSELEIEQMKSDFVATVSHELRTPLTPLKGFIGALRHNLIDDSPEARHEAYEIMWRSVGRLERLIGELLDVSRVEAGKLTLEMERVDLGSLVTACVNQFEGGFGDRRVLVEQSTDVSAVAGDRFRLDQIITNLLSNALKYSTPGSTISARVTASETHARVEVHNEGEGIPPGDQAHVFSRFYRAETGLTREVGGVGLGLFLCKWLVEAMGGAIGVESAPGEGCTFWFTVPAARSQRAAGSATEAVRAAS
jgi:PAS domain S-box-containing protein